MDPDPVIAEIRRIRQRIWDECDRDPKKLLAHYIEFQKQFADRLIPPPEGALGPLSRDYENLDADRVAEKPPRAE